MDIVMDLHTHTIASGHAYSTVNEMIKKAQDIGLSLLGITEHAPTMPNSCQYIYFQNLKIVPRKYDNLDLLLGIEANILDYEGKIDVPEYLFKSVDYAIASLHGNCVPFGTLEENTSAIIGAMKNKCVNIIGHPDNSDYPLDYDVVCKAAKENNVLLEINNTSLKPGSFRKNARENDLEMLKYCKKYGTCISLGTDAHIDLDVGKFDRVLPILKEADFPEELIINTSVEKFKNFLELKRKLIK